jgi:tetratricopeptide (TPR) repeat protein
MDQGSPSPPDPNEGSVRNREGKRGIQVNERVKQLLVLGREHYQKREFEKAEQMLRMVLEEEDRYADVHDMLGVIAHSRGNFLVAERHFERALEINPAYTEAALNLAVTYNDRGKYEKAREVYSKIKVGPLGTAAGLDPFARGKIANMHADIGQAYHDAGLPREAIREYEKATQLCPHFADLQVKLGTLFRELNDLPAARARYEAALLHKPAYVPARLQLGVTLLALGEPTAAAEQWQAVIAAEPENSQAKMYLRMLERTRGSNPPSRA